MFFNNRDRVARGDRLRNAHRQSGTRISVEKFTLAS